MKYVWKDLPKPMSCFTIRNATMKNLNTGKIVQHYSANTKIVVVQKCVTPTSTYYRTESARHHYLNYAFEASAFGLPNETAPSAPSSPDVSIKSKKRTPKSTKKQTPIQDVVLPKGGEARTAKSWIKRLFWRKNG